MQRPRGMALLSNLLGASDIVRIDAPLMVIIADSEPELNAIGSEAVAAHNARYAAGSTLYIADSAEHTLFRYPRWFDRLDRSGMGRPLSPQDDAGACAATRCVADFSTFLQSVIVSKSHLAE